MGKFRMQAVAVGRKLPGPDKGWTEFELPEGVPYTLENARRRAQELIEEFNEERAGPLGFVRRFLAAVELVPGESPPGEKADQLRGLKRILDYEEWEEPSFWDVLLLDVTLKVALPFREGRKPLEAGAHFDWATADFRLGILSFGNDGLEDPLHTYDLSLEPILPEVELRGGSLTEENRLLQQDLQAAVSLLHEAVYAIWRGDGTSDYEYESLGASIAFLKRLGVWEEPQGEEEEEAEDPGPEELASLENLPTFEGPYPPPQFWG